MRKTDDVDSSAMESLSSWMQQSVGNFTIAILPDDIRDAIGSTVNTLFLSPYTWDKQQKHHPDLTINEYLMIQTMLNSGEVILDKVRCAIVIYDADHRLMLALKATEACDEVYLSSLRKADGVREKRRLERKGDVLNRKVMAPR